MSDDIPVRLTEDGPIRYHDQRITCERGETVMTTRDYATYLVDELGYFERVTDTCQVEQSNGTICGRELPCPYHSD